MTRANIPDSHLIQGLVQTGKNTGIDILAGIGAGEGGVKAALERIEYSDIDENPYPVYAWLRRNAPVAYLPRVGAWYVSRYEDIQRILTDPENFTVTFPGSTIIDTFGEMMLTTDGELQRYYRNRLVQQTFAPAVIRQRLAACIGTRIDQLISGFEHDGAADLRAGFASRLPILVMLDLFGFTDDDEALFRGWYNSFEAALANVMGDEKIRAAGTGSAAEFHDYFQAQIDKVRMDPVDGFLNDMLSAPEQERHRDDEIRRNALVIFFGGISTVEALILNALWALLKHPAALDCARGTPGSIDGVIDETMRWRAPVHTAFRLAVNETSVAGVTLPEGAFVVPLIASANRDESVYEAAGEFRPERRQTPPHLGFATGPHLCLGRHMAKLEAHAALEAILARLSNLRLSEDVEPIGAEFHQPRLLKVVWDV